MKQIIPSIALTAFLALAGCTVAQSTKQTTELDAAGFNRAMEGEQVQLVDVRTLAEYAAGHLVGSVNIDWTAEDYEAAFAKIDKTRPVLLYCHSGGRSEQALEYLLDRGYQAHHLLGGYVAWKKAGLATVK